MQAKSADVHVPLLETWKSQPTVGNGLNLTVFKWAGPECIALRFFLRQEMVRDNFSVSRKLAKGSSVGLLPNMPSLTYIPLLLRHSLHTTHLTTFLP